jgi:hypothetical protein
MSPKQRFNFMIEPDHLRALRRIEEETGAAVGEQIRRAIASYLTTQRAVPKAEIRKILDGR